MRSPIFAAISALGVMLGGCAADQAAGPAKTLSATVSAFQADLSTYQTGVTTYQSTERSFTSGNNASRDEALAATQRLQIEWQLRKAGNPGEIFQVLQTQGSSAVAALVAPPAAAPGVTSTTLPLDKLGSVAKTMDGIAKPLGTTADAEFLVQYGIAVSNQLNALDKAGAPGTAAKPAAPGAAK
jgi:hypothetical protein